MEANYSHRDVLILQHLLDIPKQWKAQRSTFSASVKKKKKKSNNHVYVPNKGIDVSITM